MKRFALIFVSIAATVLSLTSCSSDDDDINPSFDESLIIGKWKSGTLYERYDLDYSGATWDTADDVTEAEAQNFTWTITKDQLEQIHIIENGGKVPKVYTITNLTATTLEYEDAYGKSKSFSKI
ncbi:lipocalin family protein [Marinifilum fragile]|uniref:lipocalin family protein n=1 Tax=Marinifilum fragile TaxID=570161 RepID=UPI002AA8335A|nr:lipocalin family protein [Marinifilum fragile]